MSRLISAEEISKHIFKGDLWVVIGDCVYDLTEFAPTHPGGFGIIFKYAGRDATAMYSSVHPPSLIQNGLPKSKLVGKLDPTSSLPASWMDSPFSTAAPAPTTTTTSQPSPAPAKTSKPPLSSIISGPDFERAASTSLTAKAWAFYSSAATDLVTKNLNKSVYSSVLLRPKTMVDVTNCSTTTSILGQKSTLPFFCAPAALARMVHPDGEIGIARACAKAGIPQCISTNASYPVDEIFAGVPAEHAEDMTFFFQLYVDRNRANSEALLQKVEKLGAKGIFVTVDGPVPGKREADERVKADASIESPMSGQHAGNDAFGSSIARTMGGFIDPSLSWKDIAWLRKSTRLPIVLKGVMTAADAKKAAEMGCDGVVLSNHGGRNLDTSPPPLLVLLEIQKNCPEILDKLEVLVDGGIDRGTDIFKALCLGARAVSMGRGFLWSLNYGQEGVERYIQIMRDELETTMRLCGVTDLSQVHPGLVNSLAIDHLVPSGDEHPYAKWRPKARI